MCCALFSTLRVGIAYPNRTVFENLELFIFLRSSRSLTLPLFWAFQETLALKLFYEGTAKRKLPQSRLHTLYYVVYVPMTPVTS